MCNDCNDCHDCHDNGYVPNPPGIDCCGNPCVDCSPKRPCLPGDCDPPPVTPVQLVTTEKDGNPCVTEWPYPPVDPPIVQPPVIDPEPVVYLSAARSSVRTRNNCPVGSIGSIVTTNLQAGAFSSKLSQADADQKAQQWLDAIAQVKANQQGTCSDDPTDNTVLSEPGWMGDGGCPTITRLNLLEWGWVDGTQVLACP